MEAEGDDYSADEILDDRNFNIIYPENARVKEKLRIDMIEKRKFV